MIASRRQEARMLRTPMAMRQDTALLRTVHDQGHLTVPESPFVITVPGLFFWRIVLLYQLVDWMHTWLSLSFHLSRISS